MKKTILVTSLLLALSVSLTAGMQERFNRAPAERIGGTVFAVSGTTIQLLEGLVAIDARAARIVRRGADVAISDVMPGTRVAIILKSGATTLQAETVAIMDEPEAHVAGLVDAIDVAAKSFSVLGLAISVTDDTVFVGPAHGLPVSGLSALQVNQPVGVDLDAQSGKLVALRVHVAAPAPRPSARFVGLVKSIAADAWVVTGNDNSDATFVVNAETKIVGNPNVGDRVEVYYNVGSASEWIAAVIVNVGDRPEPPVATTFEGVVKSIDRRIWMVETTPVHITGRTRFVGGPKVGDLVIVTGARAPNGDLVAAKIEKK